MPTQLLLATVGAGKTETVLQHLHATLQQAHADHSFPRVWVLLATKRQEYAFRERLAQRLTPASVLFNLEFFDAYSLSARLLHLTETPTRELHDSARLTLIRALLHSMEQAGTLASFAPIAQSQGFVRACAELIYELKQSLVNDAEFVAAARSPKDHELAHLYALYQANLRDNELVDREGMGWLALAQLESAEPRLHASLPELLIVDGFDQFSPLQATLLAQLARLIPQVLVTLTELKLGGGAGGRFEQARRTLQKAHEAVGVAYDEQIITGEQRRAPALQTLVERIFQNDHMPVSAQDCVLRLSAPSPAQEVALVLSEVKKRLLAGTRPEEILIAVRDWGLYQDHFETLRHAYGVPLLLHSVQEIQQSPLIQTVLDLVTLSDGAWSASAPNKGFARRAVLDILRSPYVRLPDWQAEWTELLERISRERVVLGGQQAWRQALQHATLSTYEDVVQSEAQADPDDEGDARTEWLYLPDALADSISLALEGFFQAVTPPEQATWLEWVLWLEGLLGLDDLSDGDDEDAPTPARYRLEVLAQVRALPKLLSQAHPHLEGRDLRALQALKRVLRGFVQAQELLRVTLGLGSLNIAYPDFLRDLQSALEQDSAQRQPTRAGRVLATTANNARGLPHEVVFIVGLAEGVFPKPTPQDPLYLDSERAELQQRAVPLRLSSERADDSGLFYELVCLARRTLVLSRPTIQAGKLWNASYLWDALGRVFTADSLHEQTLSAGEVLAWQDCATHDESFVALASALNAESATLEDAQANGLGGALAWMQAEHGQDWQAVVHGRTSEAQRLNPQTPYDAYSGRLPTLEWIEQALVPYGADYRWSASQLNNLAKCGYYWFAQRLLKLEEQQEPQVGMDVLTLGNLQHRILQEVYGAIQRAELLIQPDTLEQALALLDQHAPPVLASAPHTYGFRQTLYWEQEQARIVARLRAFIRQDFLQPPTLLPVPRKVWALEYRYEYRGSLGDDCPLRLFGFIDRIDSDAEGKYAYIIDYKSGTHLAKAQEIQDGLNFQLVVYLLAMDEQLRRQGLSLGGALYWSLKDPKQASMLPPKDLPLVPEQNLLEHELIQTALAHARQYVMRARTGHYEVYSEQSDDQRCDKYCPYYQLCRMANTLKPAPRLNLAGEADV